VLNVSSLADSCAAATSKSLLDGMLGVSEFCWHWVFPLSMEEAAPMIIYPIILPLLVLPVTNKYDYV
jgi:hypothetical protein